MNSLYAIKDNTQGWPTRGPSKTKKNMNGLLITDLETEKVHTASLNRKWKALALSSPSFIIHHFIPHYMQLYLGSICDTNFAKESLVQFAFLDPWRTLQR